MRTKLKSSFMNYGAAALIIALPLVATIGCGGSAESPTPDTGRADAIRTGGGESGNGGESTAEATGTGWGNLTGTFVYGGDPPELSPLSTGGKDAPTCNPNGVPNQSLVVDSGTKGIKNVLVFARKASRIHESYEDTADDEVIFDQEDCIFLQHVLPLRVSQELLIKNSDPIAHNTNISPPADQGTNPLLPPEGETTHKFGRQQNSPVPVSCNIHPWMKAYVIPRKDPYAVVSDEQGKFELVKLPAGEEIEFQLWHESASGGQGELVIDGFTDGKGRFTKTVEQDGSVDLGNIEIPASAFSL